MARTHGPLYDICCWAQRGADGRTGRAAAARWATQHHALAGYRSAGDVIRAARQDPELEGPIVDGLASVPDADATARQTAVAVLAPHLGRCLVRAIRAGIGVGDIDDIEADLVAETLALLARPDRPSDPAALAEAAWSWARNEGRRQRRRQRHRSDLNEATTIPAATDWPVSEAATALVIEAVRRGRLSPLLAQAVYITRVAGWPTVEAAAHLGCTVDTLRARRAPALRALAA